jgi:hypothetical protein
MSKLIICALAVLALASPTIAAAQQAPAQASADNIQIKIGKESAVTKPYVLAPQEFSTYVQPYQLETGMVLTFEQRSHRYFTRVRNEPKVEIFPLAEGVFASANGTLFVFRDEGDTIAVSHMERLPFAGNSLIDPERVYTAMR